MPKDLSLSILLDYYGGMLTQKQREVMEQYYNEDLSLAEIAENFGITRQGVRDSIKRGEAILLELEDKVGFAARTRALQAGAAELEALARDTQYANESSYTPSAKIAGNTTRMLALLADLTDQL